MAHPQTKGVRPIGSGLYQAAEREGVCSIPVYFPSDHPPSTSAKGWSLPGLRLCTGTLHYTESGKTHLIKEWYYSFFLVDIKLICFECELCVFFYSLSGQGTLGSPCKCS